MHTLESNLATGESQRPVTLCGLLHLSILLSCKWNDSHSLTEMLLGLKHMKCEYCPVSSFTVLYVVSDYFSCTRSYLSLSVLERGGAEDASRVIAKEMEFIQHSSNA